MTYQSAKDFVFKVERLNLQLRAAVCALDAIHTAMSDGPSEPRDYVDGLFFLTTALGEKTAELDAAIASALKDGAEKQ